MSFTKSYQQKMSHRLLSSLSKIALINNSNKIFDHQLTNSKMAANPIANYEEVKDLPNHPEKVLIDVRNPDELKEYGVIPTSINIPLPNVQEALKLDSAEFKAQFGRDKPSHETEVIFHCMKGGRAQKAMDIAVALGFNKARNYMGSWTDWAEREGLKK